MILITVTFIISVYVELLFQKIHAYLYLMGSSFAPQQRQFYYMLVQEIKPVQTSVKIRVSYLKLDYYSCRLRPDKQSPYITPGLL